MFKFYDLLMSMRKTCEPRFLTLVESNMERYDTIVRATMKEILFFFDSYLNF